MRDLHSWDFFHPPIESVRAEGVYPRGLIEDALGRRFTVVDAGDLESLKNYARVGERVSVRVELFDRAIAVRRGTPAVLPGRSGTV